MRWDALFDDLEGQMAAAHDDDWRAEVSERTRGERAAVDLPARIAGAQGTSVSVVLSDGEVLLGVVTDSAHAWVLLVDEGGREHLVPMAAIASISGLSGAAHHVTAVERRLGLSHALRALSRDRARVRVRTRGSETHGVIAAVYADHIDLMTDAHHRHPVAVPIAGIVEVASS